MSILHKSHLANLPDLKPFQVPPRPESISKRGLVLIPIFDGETLVDNVAHHVAISAVWGRRCWMLYTDANHYGIEVKFYVEACARDRALPILERNFVEERDIIWFDGSHLEGALLSEEGYATFGAKKTAIFTDDRLRDYDWVFEVDSDIFPMSWIGAKTAFFQIFFENCNEHAIATLFASVSDEGPPYLTAVDLGWCRGFDGSTTDETIADWKRRFDETIGDKEMLEKFMSPEVFTTSYHSGIMALPAKHFMSERREACEFFIRMARSMAGTEAMLAIWKAMGNEIIDVTSFYLPIVLIHSELHLSAIEHIRYLYQQGKYAIIHYANPCHNFPEIHSIWQEGIGAI